MFSIIIPSLNEGYYLNITLDSIYNHVDCDLLLEIIIVDDFSERDEDYKFFKKHPLNKKIKLIKNKSRLGVSKTRNLGAKIAKGDVLIFMDAHMYCKGFKLKKLSSMSKYIDLGAIQGTIGNFSDKKADGYIYKIKDKLLDTYWTDPYKCDQKDKIITQSPCCAGGFTIIKKTIFDEIGGFNELFNGWGAEDLEISLRLWMLGYKIHYTNKLYLAHYFKKSFNYKVESEKVFYNKYIIYKMYFEGKYDKSEDMLLELKKYYGNDSSETIINSIECDNIVLDFIKNFKLRFKKDINWYLKKFDNYIKL